MCSTDPTHDLGHFTRACVCVYESKNFRIIYACIPLAAGLIVQFSWLRAYTHARHFRVQFISFVSMYIWKFGIIWIHFPNKYLFWLDDQCVFACQFGFCLSKFCGYCCWLFFFVAVVVHSTICTSFMICTKIKMLFALWSVSQSWQTRFLNSFVSWEWEKTYYNNNNNNKQKGFQRENIEEHSSDGELNGRIKKIK